MFEYLEEDLRMGRPLSRGMDVKGEVRQLRKLMEANEKASLCHPTIREVKTLDMSQ